MEGIAAQSQQHEAEAKPPKSPVTNLADLPLVMKARDVQRLTRLGKDGTYALLHEAGCPTIRVGRAIRVPRDAFLRWF